MGLLRADLQALGNLPATPVGRRLAFSTLLGLGLLALLWWSVANALLHDPQLVALVHGTTGGDSLRGLLGTALMPCPITATWLGLALAQRQLFEAAELPLWRLAPIPAWRPAVQVLLRGSFLALLWASALALPFVATLLRASPAGWLAWACVPLALCVCTVPLLAVLLAVQIVLVRFFAGRALRIALALAAALASVAFSAWLLLSLFTSGPDRPHEFAAAAGRPLPWTIEAAASLLASAASGRLDLGSLRTTAAWLGLGLAVFWFAARLHPRAVENHAAAEAPLWRRRRASWPASLAANVRRKEFAQVLQQPGALIGFLVFAGMVFVLARERVLVAGHLQRGPLPAEVGRTAAMATLWFVAVLFVLYAHMGRLVFWDAPQWSLYRSAPAAPLAILRGKLEAVAVFLAWPLLLVAAAGAHQFGAGPFAVATFAGLGVAGTLCALGVLAVIGTSPRLVRPDDGPIAQSGRNLIAALLLVFTFQLAIAPAVFGHAWLEHRARTVRIDSATAAAWAPWVVAGAVLYGCVVAALGTWIGARNYRRLLQPAR